MFTVTLAFLIFGTSNMENILFLVGAVMKEALGADISVKKFSSLVRFDPHNKFLMNA